MHDDVVHLGNVTNGGWPDIYHIKEILPYYLAMPILFLFGLGISFVIRMLSNRLTYIRRTKMFLLWKEDAEPAEVCAEAYNLGVMIGLKGEKNNLQIPYDVLEYLAKKYRLNVVELTGQFMKGIMNGLKERDTAKK